MGKCLRRRKWKTSISWRKRRSKRMMKTWRKSIRWRMTSRKRRWRKRQCRQFLDNILKWHFTCLEEDDKSFDFLSSFCAFLILKIHDFNVMLVGRLLSKPAIQAQPNDRQFSSLSAALYKNISGFKICPFDSRLFMSRRMSSSDLTDDITKIDCGEFPQRFRFVIITVNLIGQKNFSSRLFKILHGSEVHSILLVPLLVISFGSC